jgi:biopolymer transport protein ExbD
VEARRSMKQINVFPMIAMLVVVLLIIAWLGGYLA